MIKAGLYRNKVDVFFIGGDMGMLSMVIWAY